MKIGVLRAKGIRKIVPFLEVGGSAPAPTTQLGIKEVLLHVEDILERINGDSNLKYCTYYLPFKIIAI